MDVWSSLVLYLVLWWSPAAAMEAPGQRKAHRPPLFIRCCCQRSDHRRGARKGGGTTATKASNGIWISELQYTIGDLDPIECLQNDSRKGKVNTSSTSAFCKDHVIVSSSRSSFHGHPTRCKSNNTSQSIHGTST